MNALRAKEFYRRDVQYIIRNGKALIINELTGRVEEKRRWSDGIHQAVEAKEGLKIQEKEFLKIFQMPVIEVPTNMLSIREDLPIMAFAFMLVESTDDEREDRPTIYTVFLPLLEGQFRAVLQGNERNELEICLESGDNAVETNQGHYLVYMHAGTNPFEVINQAVKAVEKHLQTFQHREKKKMPSYIDWFGWCTWDAFYTDVTAEGVEEGLKSLSEGGTPPRFLIIDDGWQQIGSEVKDAAEAVVQEGAHMLPEKYVELKRLVNSQEKLYHMAS